MPVLWVYQLVAKPVLLAAFFLAFTCQDTHWHSPLLGHWSFCLCVPKATEISVWASNASLDQSKPLSLTFGSSWATAIFGQKTNCCQTCCRRRDANRRGVIKEPGGSGSPWRRKSWEHKPSSRSVPTLRRGRCHAAPDPFFIFPCSSGHHKEGSLLQATSSRSAGFELGLANGRNWEDTRRWKERISQDISSFHT